MAVPDVEVVPGPDISRDPADPVSRALLKPKRLLQPVEVDPA
ncbi:hypothetical protein GCM10018771_15440 [Streptomyces cellulosae]|nr:hypothetical protein GCM10018771_15440 [Streptomyces cellulosae]